METISKTRATILINDSKGEFFEAAHVDKAGNLQQQTCRAANTPKDHNGQTLLPVYNETKEASYIILDNLLALKIGGVNYTLDKWD